MNQQDILKRLLLDQKELEQYSVKSLSLFGSVARNEEKETSDVDILVSFDKPIGIFAFMELKDHLEEILATPVDLVTEQALHPRLHDKSMEESIHVF
ncbi:MAG: putative nucleotidyltransferase [Alphaproteobacteria bacterium]|jgi:predicted nucleotidyltransferase|nr:putative nucleotidyltransferase [Alphaproteobacteria bacterium]